MKEYFIETKEASSYITDVYDNKNGTLTIQFADGRIFSNIERSPGNMQKIVEQQERQAKKGIAAYKTFKTREGRMKAKTFLSGAGVLGAAIGATFIPQVSQAISSQDPLTVVAGIGGITILGMIPSYVKLRKEKGRVKELDKLKFREEHYGDLCRYFDYPNALSGVNPRVANWIRSTQDPFNILNIDGYDLEDLVQIMNNIQVEQHYAFSYQKKPKSK